MKLVTIKKGKHLSNQLPGIKLAGDSLIYDVKFAVRSSYVLDSFEEQKDWNKLCGQSWGFYPFIKAYMMHHNSSRWGWRYNIRKGVFEITPYFYINGSRNYAELLDIKPIELHANLKYRLSIIRLNEKTVFYSVFLVEHDGKLKDIWSQKFHQEAPFKFGFIAPGYFGGTSTPKSDVEYFIQRVK